MRWCSIRAPSRGPYCPAPAPTCHRRLLPLCRYSLVHPGKVQCNKPGATTQWRRTGYTYDRYNRLTDTIYYLDDGNANYTRTRIVYDLMGHEIERYTGMTGTSTTGTAKKAQVWNHYGKVLTKTDSLNRTERYTYDSIGTLLSKVDRNGNTTLYDFDDFNRLTNERVIIGTSINTQKAFAYTPMDTVRQSANEVLNLTYTYDEAGRLIQLVNSAGSTVTYTYDIGGNRTGMVVYRGTTLLMTLAYTYDQMNRMKTVRRDGVLLATYEYDNNGNRTSKVVNASGTTTTYAYNGVNQVTSLVNKNSAGTTLSSFTYTYYLDGNQATKVESGKTTEYTYDRMGRLTVEKVSDGNQWTYTFDAFSNRKTMVVVGTQAKSVTYTYDLNNRLLTEAITGSVAETRNCTYDNNGNLLTSVSSSNVEQYQYNGFNLVSAANINGAVSQYVYRPDGLRHGKGVAGVTTLATWDGKQLVVDLIGGTPTLYVRGIGLIASIGTAAEYFLHNAHGDVVQVVNASGAVQKAYVYDAYGNQMSLNSSDTNPFRYASQYYDRESGNIYLRARYYTPRTGRFLTEDVARDGVNWYTYCGANPIMFVDPSGNSSEWQFALRHPVIAWDIGRVVQGKGKTNISTNATRFSHELGLRENAAAEGSQLNAYRHVLWTATISNKYGADIARQAVDSHEDAQTLRLGRTINSLPDSQKTELTFSTLNEADGVVDYLNNEIALQLEWNNTLPMNEVAITVLDVYHNSGLWIVEENTDGSFRIQRDILWNDQYAPARARLNMLDENGFEK